MARYFVGRKAWHTGRVLCLVILRFSLGRAAVPWDDDGASGARSVRACVVSPPFVSPLSTGYLDERRGGGIWLAPPLWVVVVNRLRRLRPPLRPPVPGRYDDAAQHHDTTTRRQRNRHHQRRSSPTAQTRHTSRYAPPARPAGLCSCHRRWPMPMPRPPLSQPPPSPARRRSHQDHRRRTYFRDRARCFAAGVK